MRILCVDDDPVYAETIHIDLCQHLQEVSWTYVDTLALGLEALREAQVVGNPYDVLLVDLMLPRETLGLFRLPQLREAFPDLVIIGLTAAAAFNEEVVVIGPRTFAVKKEQAQGAILDTLRAIETDHG